MDQPFAMHYQAQSCQPRSPQNTTVTRDVDSIEAPVLTSTTEGAQDAVVGGALESLAVEPLGAVDSAIYRIPVDTLKRNQTMR